MKKKGHLDLDREELKALSQAELIKIIVDQRETFYARIGEKDKRINELTEQLAGLNRQRAVSYTHLTLPTTPYV